MSRAWVNLRAGIGLLALTWAAGGLDPWFVGTSSAQEASPAQPIWTVPEIGALPSDTYGRLVRRGVTSSPRPTPISVLRCPIARSGLPAIIFPAAIATFRRERRSLASRCSGY